MGQAAARPAPPPMQQFPIVDGSLHFGGIPLRALAERVGRTPFYAYERHAATERIASLRRLLPRAAHLHYAVKANPMPAVVQMMTGLADGLDVASAGEMRVALDSGMAPARISFAGPGKTDAELRCAVAAGVLLHLESATEMERLAAVGAELGIIPRMAIRINPDFELKQAGMKMGGGAQQFGVDAEQVPAMLRRANQLRLGFEGFHIFSGAQNLSASAICEAQMQSVQLGLRMAVHAQEPMQVLNIGGGFGVPYFPGDRPLDLPEVAGGMERVMQLLQRVSPRTRLVIELGRYLIAEAGIYVCRVLERKVSRGETFLVTDGGLHHHLAASGNFGQVIRKNYPVAVGTRMLAEPLEHVSVVGPLCTPLDVLADRVLLPRAEAGDLIVVFQSGAYGLTASPTAFLGHPPALEVLV